MSEPALTGLYTVVQEGFGKWHILRHGEGDEDGAILAPGLNRQQAVEVASALDEAEKRGGLRMLKQMRVFINKTEEKHHVREG